MEKRMTAGYLQLTAALVAAAITSACRPETGAAEQRAAAALDRYTVRGEVVRLDAGAGAREIYIRHEPIPEFKDGTGAVVGMTAMIMPFRVANEVPLGGIAPGDKIRFRFSMDWKANRLEIESVEQLPQETVLEFARGR
jgi:Cu/Ag efflux protein CusF